MTPRTDHITALKLRLAQAIMVHRGRQRAAQTLHAQGVPIELALRVLAHPVGRQR